MRPRKEPDLVVAALTGFSAGNDESCHPQAASTARSRYFQLRERPDSRSHVLAACNGNPVFDPPNSGDFPDGPACQDPFEDCSVGR